MPARDTPHNKRPTQTERERLKKIFQANGQENKASQVAILISDKIDFRTKAIEGDFIILKGRIHQKDIHL